MMSKPESKGSPHKLTHIMFTGLADMANRVNKNQVILGYTFGTLSESSTQQMYQDTILSGRRTLISL